MNRIGLYAAAIASFAASAHAADIYVDSENGSNENGGTGWDDAVQTMAKALELSDAQSSRATIYLAPGTYPIEETIFVDGGKDYHRWFNLRSKSGNRADTIVDAQHKCPIYCEQGWSGGQVFSGITFRNGFRDGAKYASSSTAPSSAGLYFRGTTITNCVIENCFSTVIDVGGARGAGADTASNHQYGMFPTLVDTIVRNCVISNFNSKGTCGTANGAGINADGAVVRNCVVSNNWIYLDSPNLTNYSNMNIDRGLGAGIHDAGLTGPSLIEGSIICGNVATNMGSAGYGGRGGGVCLAAVSTISNCVIACNSASCTAGGIIGGKLITHCTISNNVVATKQASYQNYTAGGGACVYGTMRNCRVVGNVITKTGTRYGGGGVNLTGSAKVLDCVIEGNVSTHGGAFSAGAIGSGGASDAMISNCLIRCNNGTTQAGVITYQNPDNVVMTDCEIVNNLAGNYLFCYGYPPGMACRGLIVRNCFIHSNTNTNEGIFGGEANKYTQPIVAEYCTIADNRSGWYVMQGVNASCATNFYLRGCVLYNNKNLGNNISALGPFKNFDTTGFDYSTKTNAMYVYSDTWGCMNRDPSCHNFGDLALADFAFRDAANGDYRPTAQSGFLNMGPAPSWMSGRKSCCDMGDGTMTVSPVAGTYGVTVTRNNPSRRLNGDGPDAGCFQLPRPLGLLMFFR